MPATRITSPRSGTHPSDPWVLAEFDARSALELGEGQLPKVGYVKVGVYIDGLNLYYGGRSLFGRNAAGWKWLDLRQLSKRLIARRRDWMGRGAILERVVYCTAFLDGKTNAKARRLQDTYVSALRAHSSFDHLEQGRFAVRVRRGLLATNDANNRPVITKPNWPVMVQDSVGRPVRDARFMVSYMHAEEKGSDVNVATHLLVDVVDRRVQAAIIVSNDSDLKLPIQVARQRVPVGVVNPGTSHLAGDLRGQRDEGAGSHWWYQLTTKDFRHCQLPRRVGSHRCPRAW